MLEEVGEHGYGERHEEVGEEVELGDLVAANKALGNSGLPFGSVDTVSFAVRPKGCYTIAYSDSYSYYLGYFNTHESGSGAGTDTGDNRYVHCLAS